MARVTPSFLVDKSAYARMPNQAVSTVLAPLIQDGAVATCGIVTLEVLFSARGEAEFRALLTDIGQRFSTMPTEQRDFDRATEVMGLMSPGGRHRAVPIPDLLIAAVAERNYLTVIHYDQDFDRIAEVTGQAMMWVVPKGSL